ncbi:uncharacterized protein LOC130701329 [Daphnia carinata]|uniref:uncharacterized protein LOC130701329 n=1 Tax=Daphnia carinata TaxID=120202 RepID=UPI00258083DB|nr:uncharacterized protein LOC130701329 [Daphnia carinata]
MIGSGHIASLTVHAESFYHYGIEQIPRDCFDRSPAFIKSDGFDFFWVRRLLFFQNFLILDFSNDLMSSIPNKVSDSSRSWNPRYYFWEDLYRMLMDVDEAFSCYSYSRNSRPSGSFKCPSSISHSTMSTIQERNTAPEHQDFKLVSQASKDVMDAMKESASTARNENVPTSGQTDSLANEYKETLTQTYKGVPDVEPLSLLKAVVSEKK